MDLTAGQANCYSIVGFQMGLAAVLAVIKSLDFIPLLWKGQCRRFGWNFGTSSSRKAVVDYWFQMGFTDSEWYLCPAAVEACSWMDPFARTKDSVVLSRLETIANPFTSPEHSELDLLEHFVIQAYWMGQCQGLKELPSTS